MRRRLKSYLQNRSFIALGKVVPRTSCPFLLLLLICSAPTAPAQDQTVNGDLDVTGTVDVRGDAVGIGTRSDTALEPGVSLEFVDGTTSSLEFRSGRASHQWLWLLNSASGFKSQMTLGTDNVLVIFDKASTPAAGITLSPTGLSTFQQSVLVNGTDNRLANQTLADDTSILTRVLADARYAKKGVTVILGSGTSAGSYSTSTGMSTAASGNYSFAGGNGSEAQGEASAAFGNGSISVAESSFAAGNNVKADGGFASVALGSHSLAEGYVSQSIGYYNWTRGWFTTALGSNNEARGMGQLVIGQFNIAQGTMDEWVPTDDLFIIGNGINDSERSNALVVKKNGDTTIYGKTTLTQGGEVDGPLRITPQGDLSMGIFTETP